METLKKILTFSPGSSADDRKNFIQEELKKKNASHIIEGYLLKSGYDPIEYGYGDEDLVFADQIEIHYQVNANH